MKKIKKIFMAIVFGLVVSLAASTSVSVEPAKVEAAKRDKKKPKITFKGATKLTAEEGEAVTIPKTTYSDNLTKKKKLKIGVKVKKGKKNYKTIANKIKKATVNNKATSVEFPEDGTYKITYTVTDLAKNVAVKTRTVVVEDKKIEEEEIITKEDPIPATTEEEQKRVVPTEEPKTEEPKKEDPTSEKVDLSEFADYETVNINGNDYNVVDELKKEPVDVDEANLDDTIFINYSNIPFEDASIKFPVIIGVGRESEFAGERYLPLYVVGKITAGFVHEYVSKDGLVKTFNDLSENVLLDYKDDQFKIKLYIVDDNSNFYYIKDIEYRVDKFNDLNVEGRNLYGLDVFNDYSVNTDSQVIVAPGLSTNELNIKQKKLTLNKIDLGKE